MAPKILIVDQDDSFSASLERQLVGSGYEVVRAPDGVMGIQYALRHRPNLIIADVECPAGGGVSMLTSLRRSVFTRDIPVLMLAGPGNPASKKKMLEFNMLTYLQKPFSNEELLAGIKEFLPADAKIVTGGDFVPPPPSQSEKK